jgi:hypothetical protein
MLHLFDLCFLECFCLVPGRIEYTLRVTALIPTKRMPMITRSIADPASQNLGKASTSTRSDHRQILLKDQKAMNPKWEAERGSSVAVLIVALAKHLRLGFLLGVLTLFTPCRRVTSACYFVYFSPKTLYHIIVWFNCALESSASLIPKSPNSSRRTAWIPNK